MRLAPPLWSLFAALVACSGGAADTCVPDLPDPDPIPDDDIDDDWPIDTDLPTPPGRDPGHWLYTYQTGAWALGPEGGPHTTLSGELLVLEFVDWSIPEPDPDTDEPDSNVPPWELLDESPLHCTARWLVTGEAADTLCPSCDAAFEVTFTLVEGDPRPCYDPDLPANGETRRFGWRASDGFVQYDHSDLGAWFPWFNAEFSGDLVLLSFADRRAISLPEDDD
jgi:hypothetical protein